MMRRRANHEEGQALVETALAAVVMIGVLLAMFEMLMAFYSYHYISYAAREGSRYAMVRGSDCSTDSTTMPNCGVTQTQLQTYIQGLNFPGIQTNNLTVTASWLTATTTTNPQGIPATIWVACATGTPGTCNQPGNQVQVQVQYKFPLNLPFFSSTTLNMSSTSSMVISQ